ncbi:hypothetical protein BS78_10G198200 [Paspalum vaginatum]|nr:hypothetical protein BS78_10G198200 [Paspalum vaginatum]
MTTGRPHVQCPGCTRVHEDVSILRLGVQASGVPGQQKRDHMVDRTCTVRGRRRPGNLIYYGPSPMAARRPMSTRQLDCRSCWTSHMFDVRVKHTILSSPFVGRTLPSGSSYL